MRAEPRAAALLFLLSLAGCASSPTSRDPESAVAPTFVNAPEQNDAVDEIRLAAWWRGFGDGQLDGLVQRAIASNRDLRIARANVREARALKRATELDRVPTVQGTGGFSDSQASQAVSAGSRDVELYDAGFDAAWELDLFGRVDSSIEAARAGLEAVDATRQNVLVTVIAEVARNYFELRGLQLQLDVARKNVAIQARTLELTEALLEGGRGTALDVSRSRSLLNLTRAGIPPLEAAAGRATNRLAVLTGRRPDELGSELTEPKSLPATLPPLALGDPAGLLRRRPDIRAAERSLAAANATTEVVAADLFPRVTFVGSVGLGATSFADLASAGADTWQFGPRIRWAALDLGRVRARMRAADARAEASLAFYERTVLGALEETENALIDIARQREQQVLLEASVAASEQALDLAQRRYDAGVTDFLSLLDAQRTLLDTQDRLAASQTRTVTALVAVYKALGGGPEGALD